MPYRFMNVNQNNVKMTRRKMIRRTQLKIMKIVQRRLWSTEGKKTTKKTKINSLKLKRNIHHRGMRSRKLFVPAMKKTMM